MRKTKKTSLGVGFLLIIVTFYMWQYFLPISQTKTTKNAERSSIHDSEVKIKKSQEKTMDDDIQIEAGVFKFKNDDDEEEEDDDEQSDESATDDDENEFQKEAIAPMETEKEPVYIDLRPLFNMTAIGDDILKAEPIKFLAGVKNPCYAVDKGYINVGNINITYAMEKGYQIYCLPYAYQAGFPKCGTNNLFFSIIKIRYIWGGVKDGSWRHKETHFWDNHKCKINATFHNYTVRYFSDKIVESLKKYGSSPRSLYDVDDQRDMIFIDGTPRTLWHGDDWPTDEANKGLKAPEVLIAHKLHRIQPNVKIYLSLRNPTDRMLSDYKFYYHTGNQTAEDFHKKVVEAIGWWKTCTEVLKLPLRACAYGKAPEELPQLSFSNCADKPILEQLKLTDPAKGLCYRQWDSCSSAANRLRVGLYDIYIKDWLKLFPRKNFLFLKFEEFIKDPVTVYDNEILPFLEHPPLSDYEKAKLTSKGPANTSKSSWKMWPSTRNILDEFYQKSKENLVEISGDKKFLWQ